MISQYKADDIHHPIIVGNKASEIILGNSLNVLKQLPEKSIDCVITSPPYWGLRDYDVGLEEVQDSIGMESTFDEYLSKLLLIFCEVKRVLKDNGSFWLNIGDRYRNKDLLGMPWRVALALKDQQNWILRSDIIWNKIRMTQSAKDRVRNIHEYIFHFVKSKHYYFDYRSIYLRHEERPTKNLDGSIVSITGTSGVKYRKQIQRSTSLSPGEKKAALLALNETIEDMRSGKILDFRMTIRGSQRPAHGSSTRLSGRAKELEQRGFYIITQKTEGYLPTDIWEIVPEDTHRTDSHCSVYPPELLEIPIRATCPVNGIVLDPFVGTGTTIVAALGEGRKAIGIDISENYVTLAERRVKNFLGVLAQVDEDKN